MAPWNKTTAPVLRRVRKLTLIVEGQLNEPDIACANKVWAHLGVEMARYKEKDNWDFVEKALRPQVREKLEAIFDLAAFFVDGLVANPARDKFKKADLLKWGDRLLADAAANKAMTAANAAAGGAEAAVFNKANKAADEAYPLHQEDASFAKLVIEDTDGRGAGPPPGAAAPPSISSEDPTSLRRSVRKGCSRLTGRSGFFSGKGRLTAEAVASLNSCPSSVASNANHNRTATSFTQSRSDRSPWDRISYHSSQLSAKLARSFPSRKKCYVPPPRVLRDELEEKEAWERINAKVDGVTRMREETLGRDSTLDAVEREDRISEVRDAAHRLAEYKTFGDELREARDAVELGEYEFIEQRIDSLVKHLHTQLSRRIREVRDVDPYRFAPLAT